MTEPPPRKRFQIHLSTAIVMMFVAGALIWANTHYKFTIFSHRFNVIQGRIGYGWPCLALLPETPGLKGGGLYYEAAYSAQICYQGVMIDVVVVTFILILLWFLCEWLIRRRAAWKEA